MRRLVRLTVRLYPARWRQRYAREFEAFLDDVNPGAWELIDIMKGALSMQIRTFGAIVILCALSGAAVGGFVAMRTPAVFESSAILVVRGGDTGNPEEFLQTLDRPLIGVLGHTENERAATRIAVGRGVLGRSVVRVSYRNRDAIQAQQVAARLTSALVSSNAASWSAVVVESPVIPGLPIEPKYAVTIAFGTIVGLLFGGIAMYFWRLRQRPANE